MLTMLDHWGEAVALSGADDDAVYVPQAVTQTLGESGRLAALGVYGLLLLLVAAGKNTTLEVLASYSPTEDPETIRDAVQQLFDLRMIPQVVAAAAAART